MEANILEKLQKLQNAHNELGNSYEEIAQSKSNLDLKSLNTIYNQQTACIAELRNTISNQREIIRKLDPSDQKPDLSGEFRVESIFCKYSQLEKPKSLQRLPPKQSLLYYIKKRDNDL